MDTLELFRRIHNSLDREDAQSKRDASDTHGDRAQLCAPEQALARRPGQERTVTAVVGRRPPFGANCERTEAGGGYAGRPGSRYDSPVTAETCRDAEST